MGIYDDYLELQAAAKADRRYLPLLEEWMRAMNCVQQRGVIAKFKRQVKSQGEGSEDPQTCR